MTAAEKEYGGALYALAAEEHCEDAVLEGLTLAADAFRETPGYLKLVQNPAVPREERLAMLDEAFGAGVHVYVLNFLKILCGKSAFFKYPVLYLFHNSQKMHTARMAVPISVLQKDLWLPYILLVPAASQLQCIKLRPKFPLGRALLSHSHLCHLSHLFFNPIVIAKKPQPTWFIIPISAAAFLHPWALLNNHQSRNVTALHGVL